jgi:ADP-heptose:LPS heptosyltransferase
MKIATMRRIDAWIGVPLCLLATTLRGVLSACSRSSVAAGKPRSVLIIKLSELGALITLAPAMRRLSESAERSNVYFLTFSESRELLEVLDYVPRENLFTLNTRSFPRLLWSALLSLRQIRRRRIECSLDLDFFSRATALIGWLSGCRRRVGCHAYFGEGPYRGDLLTHRVKFNPHLHVSQMFEVMAAAVEKPGGGFPRIDWVPHPVEPPRARFQPTPAELAAVRRILAAVGAGLEDRLVLLNSNISDREAIPLRKWPDECYVELAKRILTDAPHSTVLFTGSPGEADSVAGLAAGVGHPRCRSVAGKTTFRELLTLYSLSNVIITNDSGPAHFATLTNIQVVVLFGPETPLLWRPLGDRVRVVYRGLACSPCFTVHNGRQSRCRRNACMDISPAEVNEVVQQQWKKAVRAGEVG